MEHQSTTALVENPFGQDRAVHGGAFSDAMVQREIAEVQAAVIMAKRFPRDPIAAMDRILQAFTRPSLCSEADGRTPALYEYARGGQDISGLSIRAAEVLAQNWGNILCGVSEVARRPGESECVAFAWDLETNFRDERRFMVKHQRETKRGRYVLTDERDIYEAVANYGSRRKRACLLAVIPGDVQEAARQQIDLTLKATIQVTPERIQHMLEVFGEYQVTKEMLETRIQRRLDSITPALFVQLGKIANSLRDRMSTPGDWFEVPDDHPSPDKTTGERVKEQIDRRRGKAAAQQGDSAVPPDAPPSPSPDADAAWREREEIRRELLMQLEDRLLAEHQQHGEHLPEMWAAWERDLEHLKAMPIDAAATNHMLSQLADALVA